MSSRCKACNSILTDEELMETRPDGEPEDLCRWCRSGKSLGKNKNSDDYYCEDWPDFLDEYDNFLDDY